MSRIRTWWLRLQWAGVGAALAGIPVAYLITAANDTRDADRTAQIVAAHRAGFHAGAMHTMCLGIRVDGRTGEVLR